MALRTPSSKTLRYIRRLVAFESTSDLSNRLITRYLQTKLLKHGFQVERLGYRDRHGVRKINLVAKKGRGVGGLAYFGHTDTVPAATWFTRRFSPFQPVMARYRIYGRGACDMKGSLAAMLSASQQYDASQLTQPLYFVATADEEIGFHGARNVVEESRFYREIVDAQTRVVIGEPTSLDVVHAHKGSTLIRAVSRGKAAHSSTADGVNANLAIIPLLNELKAIHEEVHRDARWQNDAFSPPTLSWNIGINDHTGATNITPPQSVATVYVRPMPGVDIGPLVERVRRVAAAHDIELTVQEMAQPVWLDPNHPFVQEALALAGRTRARTVAYGTDAGVLADLKNVIICGPGNIEQAHTDHEWISLDQLMMGAELYAKMIRHWCCQ